MCYSCCCSSCCSAYTPKSKRFPFSSLCKNVHRKITAFFMGHSSPQNSIFLPIPPPPFLVQRQQYDIQKGLTHTSNLNPFGHTHSNYRHISTQ